MKIDSDGVPVCPIGRKMIWLGQMSGSTAHQVALPGQSRKLGMPTPCWPSEYGRSFYTSAADNPRLFSRIRRDSKEWAGRYALRTGVERCIKRQKVDYKLESSRGRSSRHWNIRVYLIAMGQHADAWLEEAKKQRDRMDVAEWLQAFDNA